MIINYQDHIQKWLNHALTCQQMEQYEFDSIDVLELTGKEDIDSSNQVTMAFDLYEELIRQYLDNANKYSAELIVSTGDTERVQSLGFEDLLNGKIPLRQPPELYMRVRRIEEPLVQEKYVVRFGQQKVHGQKGVIDSAFYSTHSEDVYSNEFWFKHYLDEQLELVNGTYYVNYR